jgi:hypothetical protein
VIELEAQHTVTLPGINWSADTNPRTVSGGEFNVTNSLSFSNLFFMLREL